MEKARQSHALLWVRIRLTCCRVVAGRTLRAGFMVHDGYICSECDCRMPVGRTVWYCDICDVDICSSCMGYGENPYGHAARARALPEVCIAADRAHRAAQDAATLAPLSLLEHPPFREKSLHVSNEWLTNAFPSMVVRVLDAHFTPNRSHVQRRICVESRRDGEEVDAWELQTIAYTPAREHESPASQRRRSMRFRRREEQAISRIQQRFDRLIESEK